jgi:signal transduction histidine kinase
MTFPVADTAQNVSANDAFAAAYELEYQQNDPNKAIDEYRRIAQSAEKDTLRIYADISQARCLYKLKRDNEAIAALKTVLSRYDNSDQTLRVQKCHARLLLLELCRRTGDKYYIKELSDTFYYAFSGMPGQNDYYLYDLAFLGREPYVNDYIPSELQIFVLQKCIAYAQDFPNDSSFQRKCKMSQSFIEQARLSLQVADQYIKPALVVHPDDIYLFRLETKEPLYGTFHKRKDFVLLMIHTKQNISSWFDPYLEDLHKLQSECSIYDAAGTLIAGKPMPSGRKPFIKSSLASEYFPEWTVALYMNDSVFETAADRQRLLYIWSSVLVIVLMMVFVSLAGREVLHQARLNRIKNNFVATVTHELKTPLSSMRLLVDTLLDGSYTNPQQCKEYLELISHENERLSRMIDSFLTFSRMERNKQVFDFQSVNPADIVHAAAQVVQTKMTQPGCHFIASADVNLPPIRADKDAMITVLVNLLDNAYKYSNPEKTIELRAYRENNMVCFTVKDDGIGIPRRIQKKIFDRFYQADNRLSRQAEGCGLGLSIVKFIVNAHKGQIHLESKPGQGSRFTVRIPT